MLWDEPKIFFLERRYFFSIILSEFLKNRVALHQGDNDADDDLQDLRDAVDDVGERFSQAAEGVHMGSSLSVQNLAAAARKPSTSSAVVAKQVTKRMTVVSGVGPGHQSS